MGFAVVFKAFDLVSGPPGLQFVVAVITIFCRSVHLFYSA